MAIQPAPTSLARAVFLDRDGVVVRERLVDCEPFAPLTLDQFAIVPEAPDEVARLRQAGFRCIVFTNQPEISKGLLAPEILAEMHRQLAQAVPLDGILVCPHQDADRCACRKPLAGMLRDGQERWGLDLGRSYVVGDRWRDIEAGRAVGARTVLIDRPYSDCATADARAQTLGEAVSWILVDARRAAGPD